jgi:hypothetical protein
MLYTRRDGAEWNFASIPVPSPPLYMCVRVSVLEKFLNGGMIRLCGISVNTIRDFIGIFTHNVHPGKTTPWTSFSSGF